MLKLRDFSISKYAIPRRKYMYREEYQPHGCGYLLSEVLTSVPCGSAYGRHARRSLASNNKAQPQKSSLPTYIRTPSPDTAKLTILTVSRK